MFLRLKGWFGGSGYHICGYSFDHDFGKLPLRQFGSCNSRKVSQLLMEKIVCSFESAFLKRQEY